MSLLQLTLFLVMIALPSAHNEYRQVSDSVSYGGQLFTFHEQRLSWPEAASVCRSLGGYLAIVNNMELAMFLAVSQTRFDEGTEYGDVWIGGRLKNKKWIWKATGEVIPDTVPPWTPEKRNNDNHNCLTFSNYNSQPHFINKECTNLQSFLCQKVADVDIELVDVLDSNGHKYSVYKGLVSWDAAVAFCREKNEYLAAPTYLQEVRFLSRVLASSHLGIKYVWLGGRMERGGWVWSITGDLMPMEIQNDGYPPWIIEDQEGGACLVLDASVQDKPYFSGTNCTNLHNFICEQDTQSNKHVLTLHGYDYLFFSRKLSWDQASLACESENANLAAVEDRDTVLFVAKNMVNAMEAPHALWLGARRTMDGTWEWTLSGEELSARNNYERGYPIWADSPEDKGRDCLSFETAASARKRSHFVRKHCDTVQAYLCQRVEATAEPKVTQMVVGDRTFLIHQKPESWETAVDICKNNSSHLAVMRDNDELTFLYHNSDMRRLWVGGRRVSDEWKWLQLGETIPNTTDDEGFPPMRPYRHSQRNLDCLELDLHGEAKLSGLACNTTLSFVCDKIVKNEEKHIFQDRVYMVYSRRVTWHEAAAICRSHGYYLAIASDLLEARFFARLTREYYELWLGGVRLNGSWEWEHTGESIPDTPSRNGYPPWGDSAAALHHACLTINTGYEGSPVFVGTQCSTQQAFVCEQGGEDITWSQEPVVALHAQRSYTFHRQRLTWSEASEDCQDAGGYLVTLTDTDNLNFITKHIQNMPDVWVGGHLVDGKWVWSSSLERIPQHQDGETFPPWARMNPRLDHDCLVINRHNPDRPILVDLPCNSTQPYVCERVYRSAEGVVETVHLPDRDLIFVESRVDFNNATQMCEDYNGFLAIVNTAELSEIIKEHVLKYRGAWVGARSDESGTLRWIHTGQELTGVSIRSMLTWQEDDELMVEGHPKTSRHLGLRVDIPPEEQDDKSTFKLGELMETTTTTPNPTTTTNTPITPTTPTTPTTTTNTTITPTTPNKSFLNISEDIDLTKSYHITPPKKSIAEIKLMEGDRGYLYYTVREPAPSEPEEHVIPSRTTSVVRGQPTNMAESSKWNELHENFFTQDETTESWQIRAEHAEVVPTSAWTTEVGDLTTDSEDWTTDSDYWTSGTDDWTTGPTFTEEMSGPTFIARRRTRVSKMAQKWKNISNNNNRRINEPYNTIYTTDTIFSKMITEHRINEIKAMKTNYSAKILSQMYKDKIKYFLDSSTYLNDKNYTKGISHEDKGHPHRGTNTANHFTKSTSDHTAKDLFINYSRVNEKSSAKHFISHLLNKKPSREKIYRMAVPAVIAEEGVTTLKPHKFSPRGSSSHTPRIFQIRRQPLFAPRPYKRSRASTLKVDLESLIDLEIETTTLPHNTNKDSLNSDESISFATFVKRTSEENELTTIDNSFVPKNGLSEEDSQDPHSLVNDSDYLFETYLSATETVSNKVNTISEEMYTFSDETDSPDINKPSDYFLELIPLVSHSDYNNVATEHLPDESSSETESFTTSMPINTNTSNEYEPLDDDLSSVSLENLSKDLSLGIPTFSKLKTTMQSLTSKSSSIQMDSNGISTHITLPITTRENITILASSGSGISNSFPIAANRLITPSLTVKMANVSPVVTYSSPVTQYSTSSSKLITEISKVDLNFTTYIPTTPVNNINITELNKRFVETSYSPEVDTFSIAQDSTKLPDSLVHLESMVDFYSKEHEHALIDSTDSKNNILIAVAPYFNNTSSSRLSNTNQINHSSNNHQTPVEPIIPPVPNYHDPNNNVLTTYTLPEPITNMSTLDVTAPLKSIYFERESRKTVSNVSTLLQSTIDSHLPQNYTLTSTELTSLGKEVFSDLELLTSPPFTGELTQKTVTSKIFLSYTSEIFPNFEKILLNDEETPTRSSNWVEAVSTSTMETAHKSERNVQEVCVKLNEKGQLIERPCSTLQSFVCERRSKVSQPLVRTYSYHGRLYSFSTEKVTWDKARVLCQNSNSYLAVLASRGQVDFVANVSRDFQDLWIGGHVNMAGVWEWAHTGRIISTDGDFPPWVNRPTRLGNDCLNVYRQSVGIAVFVDRPCDVLHGFVCEDAMDTTTAWIDSPKMETVEYHGHTLMFFSERVSWDRANEICVGNNGVLATLDTEEKLKLLDGVSPVFHDLWVGVDIQSDVDQTNDSQTIALRRSTSAAQNNRNCANIYRPVDHTPFIVARPCEELHPFVCEEINNHTLTHNGRQYVFHVKRLNWEDAFKECSNHGQYLAVANDVQEAQYLAAVGRGFHEMWLGGRRNHSSTNPQKWIWEHTGEQFDLQFGESNFPVDRTECVSLLQREDSDDMFHSGDCARTLAFICEDIDVDSVPAEQGAELSGHRYVFYSTPKTWVDAEQSCRANGSYLATINKMEEALFLVNNTRGFHDLWVGGHRNHPTWEWVHTGEPLQKELLPSQFPMWGDGTTPHGCLNIHRPTIDSFLLVDRNCNELRGYVCEESSAMLASYSQSYRFGDTEYLFYTKRVTWYEATHICQSRGHHLAIVDTRRLLQFIYNVNNDFHDLWVDGRKENNLWKWTTNQKPIPPRSDEMFPPWIHNTTRPEHLCLNLYRPAQDVVHFVDRRCEETFGFICQGGGVNEKSVETFEINGRQYTFYGFQVDYNKARTICESNGTYLALLSTHEEAKLVIKYGKMYMPVWIGGRIEGGMAVWVHTGELIPDSPGYNGYPTWGVRAHQPGNCVLFDRTNGDPLFQEETCDKLHGFVCEEAGDKGGTQTATYEFEGQTYAVSNHRVTWESAEQHCQNNGTNLAMINNARQTAFLDSLNTTFHDLWLGGRQSGRTWLWQQTGQVFGDMSQDGYSPQFVTTPVSQSGERCLNLYRPSVNISLFIGRKCDDLFGFVCEGIPVGATPHVHILYYNNRSYSVSTKLSTWVEASAACKAEGGYLAMVTDMNEAIALTHVHPRYHDVWIGGHVREHSWAWEHTGEALSSTPTNKTKFPPWITSPQRPSFNCLSLRNHASSPKFVESRCAKRMGFACEEVGPSEDVQLAREYHGHRYVFTARKVTWAVAADLCQNMKGYLAIAGDNDELKFLINQDTGFHDVWVDGRVSDSRWEWEHTGQKIPPPTKPLNGWDIVAGLVPNWLRFPTRLGYECLNIFRGPASSPFLVDQRCTNRFAFVCEDVPESTPTVPEVRFHKDRRYEFIFNRVSWDEADRVCHKKGGYLTIIDDMEEAYFLTNSSELHDTWIGASRKRGHPWYWTHTGEMLNTNVTDNAVDLFANRPQRIGYDCFNLFRDKNNKPLFVDRRCAQRFGFICEEVSEPQPIIELNSFRGRYYLFSSHLATWDDAVATCNRNGSYLAIVDDVEEAKFIVNASRYFHDTWVGGHRTHDGQWEWTHTGQEVPGPNDSRAFLRWINNLIRPNLDCVNIYRDSGNRPYFLERSCQEKHAFVCEEASESVKLHSDLFELNGRMYSFNSDRVTWQEAEVLCRNKGSYLAVVSELQEAAFIMQASQDFHDLWLGGRWNNDHWYWSHTGEVIQDVGGFPVWAHNFTRPDHDCLNLYRGAKEQEVLYVDRQCNETHGFVCEEALNGEEGLVEELHFRGNTYLFTNMRMTWNDAYDVCASNDSMLPVVFDRETAIFLAEAGREYHDMWLGGHVEEAHWAWKPKNRRIPTTSGEHEFPEWIRASPRPDHDCLSLYRDTENKPLFLDRKCDEKQVIVCQKYNTILGEALETFEFADRHFTFLRRPEIWSDAVDICKLNGSFLPILTDETLTRFIAEKTDSVPEIWTDGHSRDSLWFWELTSEEVPMVPDEDGFPAWARDNPELDCLALDMTAVNNPVFSDVDCYQPRPFVCETGCVPLGQPKQGHWSRPECYTNVARHGEECELVCNQGAELWGKKRLTCGKDRWGNTVSSCIGTEHLGDHFVKRLNLTLNAVIDVSLKGTGLLFVLAKTSNMGQSNFNSVQEFTKSVAASVRLAPNLVSSGVITFGSSPKLAVPLSTSDTCTFFESVDQITYEYDDGDNLDYNQVLELAKSVINHTSLIQRTVIVLLVDGLSSSELGSIVSDMKALGTIFFTVGIGDVNGDVLEQIASTPTAAGLQQEEHPNFYYLSSFTAFGEMVNFLNETYLYSGNVDCCMRLQEQTLGIWSPPSCSQTHGVLNSTCSMTCHEGFELVGDPTLTCTPRGWFGFTGKARVPTCHSIVAVAHLMFDAMENELAQFEKVAILFLLDHSNSMTNDDFVKQTSFVKMMINKFLLSEDRVAGLITFNTHAVGVIPLNTSKTCSFLMSLEKVKFQGGGTNFEAALIAAEEEINKYDMNNQTIIFLMTDGRSQGNPRNVADRLKSKGNVIFTLGVGGYKRPQLEPIATVGRKNKKPYFFSASDFQALQEAVSYINNTYMRSSEKHCCMTLSQKLSGTWSPGECSTTPSEESDNCSILCDPGYGLFGSPQVTCTRTGWSQVTTSCFAKADTISQLISNNIRDTIDSFDGVDALLFIVDQTERLEKDSFTVIIEFIKAIITRFPLHDKHTAGLISSHKMGSDIDIDINTKKTCSFLDKLSGVKFMRGSPSLGKALKLAKKIQGHDRENATLIILITDRQMIPSTTLTLARKVRSGNKKILVVAVDNRDARPRLLAISSDNNRTAQNLISLDSYDTLEAVTEFMMEHEHLLSWYADTGYLYPNCAEL